MTNSVQMQRIENKDPKETRKEEQPRERFEPKKSRKKIFPKQVEDDTLAALKAMLEKYKDTAEAGYVAFAKTEVNLASFEKEAITIGKLKPSAQVMQLFAKLADSLVHMEKTGVKVTTVTLGDAFNSSIFKNGTFTLTEYSTAPKVFNIEFSASEKGVAFFEAHAATLASALKEGNFNFGIHRIDTSIQTEREHLIEKVTEKEEEE